MRDRDQRPPFPGPRSARFATWALATAALALAFALPSAASAAQTLTVEKAGAGTLTSSPAGIECGPNCMAAFTDGATVTLTGAPGPNTQPAQWSGCNSVNVENKCIVTMSAARSVTATFDLVQRQLTVTKAGLGTGTVTSSPGGISCGSTCAANYEHGTSVTLSGAPGPNTQAVQWTGCGAVTAEDKCVVTMSAAKAVSATFDLEKHLLTVSKAGSAAGISSVESSPGPIACGLTCQASFDHGTTVTLTGTPGAHTFPAQWTGCDSVNLEDKCKVTMSAAKSVTATFNLIQFGLTVTKAGPGAPNSSVTSSPAAIACGATCSATLTEGAVITLSGNPGPNTKAAQWTNCPSIVTGKCIVTMSAAKSVTATFEPQAGAQIYPLAVAKGGDGEGTVTGSPGGIDCGAVCQTELIEGAVVSLSATPAPGSVFDHWSGGGCTGPGVCVTTLKGAKTVTAIFSLAGTRTLAIQKAGSGQGTVTSRPAGTGIDCGQTCSSQVPASTKVTLTAKAATGSAFARWSGACQGTAATCKVTMTEARSVTAAFSGSSASTPPPSSCVVPKLARKSLSQARSALRAAHCALGKVSKPKARKGKKLGPLLVKSSSPAPGATLPAGGKVDIRLKRAGKKRSGSSRRG